MQCAKNAVLFPGCVTAGRWTITPEQLTYHHLDQHRGETGVAYVFSRDQSSHLQLLHDQGDPQAVDKMLHDTFLANSTDAQYFWDGSKWLSHTRQQVAEGVHVAAL